MCLRPMMIYDKNHNKIKETHCPHCNKTTTGTYICYDCTNYKFKQTTIKEILKK